MSSDNGNSTIVDTDEGPRRETSYERIASLAPAFEPEGMITAGNSSQISDGAAAVLVMSEAKAEALGVTPLARIVASGVSALDPEIMGLGPIDACRQALARAGMTALDQD